MAEVSRRRFLAAGATMAAAGAVGGVIATRDHEPSAALVAAHCPVVTDASARSASVPFHGAHQAGIVTAQQRHLVFAAFDVSVRDRAALADLVRRCTAAAEDLCAGRYGRQRPPDEPPQDSGEVVGTGPAGLTLTVGFGSTLFSRDGVDRFGLAARAPRRQMTLPPFRTDRLLPERSGGDLCLQACADDPLVVMHAVRVLRRVAGPGLVLRWLQAGFLGGEPGGTPRNLFGYKEGTANPAAADEAALTQSVWVGDDDVDWLRGGSYLVARRIHMRVERWDQSSLAEQEATIGRRKLTGAPLGGVAEGDAPRLAARDAEGRPVIPATAHIRLAAPASNGGARLLRRGYSFLDGDDGAADFEAGLMFLAYQRDPERQFVAIARRLSAADALNEYVTHTGSGVFACPPGTSPGTSWGQALLDA